MTRGQLPQRAGLLGLYGGGAAAAVPPTPLPSTCRNPKILVAYLSPVVNKE